MSALNGDRARFQINRKRKLRRRRRIRVLAARLNPAMTSQLERPAAQLAIPRPELKSVTDDRQTGPGWSAASPRR